MKKKAAIYQDRLGTNLQQETLRNVRRERLRIAQSELPDCDLGAENGIFF